MADMGTWQGAHGERGAEDDGLCEKCARADGPCNAGGSRTVSARVTAPSQTTTLTSSRPAAAPGVLKYIVNGKLVLTGKAGGAHSLRRLRAR